MSQPIPATIIDRAGKEICRGTFEEDLGEEKYCLFRPDAIEAVIDIVEVVAIKPRDRDALPVTGFHRCGTDLSHHYHFFV